MISPDKLTYYRKRRGLTQEELAEHSGISIRTIQRIEKGLSAGSPYTLKVIAEVLEVSTDDLFRGEMKPSVSSEARFHPVKLMNLSALSMIILPLGNIILPLLVFLRKPGNSEVETKGRKILSFQILYTLSTLVFIVIASVVMLLFFERLRGSQVPIFVPLYFLSVLVNICITMKLAVKLGKEKEILRSIPNIL